VNSPVSTVGRRGVLLAPRALSTLIPVSARADDLSLRNDSLPSWNDTKAKKAIPAFVDSAKKPSSPDFLLRLSVSRLFDNGGTARAADGQGGAK
jgi:hypothetical protein